MDGPSFSRAMEALYLLGAAQGLFLAAVLASRRRNTTPNRLLAAVMLVFSLDLAMAVYHAGGYDAAFPHLIGADAAAALLYGPLLYLYARTLAGPDRALRRRDALHFLPFATLALFLLPFYAKGGAEKLALLQDPTLDPRTRALVWLAPLKLLHGFVYLGLVVALLRRHRARLRDAVSSTERLTLAWLRHLTVGIVALMAVALGLYLLGARGVVPGLGMDPAGRYDDLTLLAVTVFVYAMGYLGLRQPEVFAARAAVEERPRYARSGMDPAVAERVERRLLALMEAERPYRRGDLTLQDLAAALGVSPHNLTEVLSTRVGLSFYDFVNGYRVREVQARLADPAFAGWSLLAIGLEAGFNAKSSFNAAFKRHTGETPSAYRARLGLPA